MSAIPELSRIERMIEDETDPKQRCILILLHYLTISVTTSLSKLTMHDDTLNKYSILLANATGASTVLKVIFTLTHAAIVALLVGSATVVMDMRDTITVNSIRITTLEKMVDTHDKKTASIIHDK